MSERKTSASVRWLIAAAVASALGWASLHALKAARTHDDVYWAIQSLRIWAVPSQYAEKDWVRMWERLENAKAIEPDNPDIEEFLGLLAARRFDDPQRLGEAPSHHIRALALRPISAGSWANLAAALYQTGDTGPRFRVALENASRLAPSNPQVQSVVALYGLAVLDEVAPETRRIIESMVAAGMRRDPLSILSIAQRRGKLDVACRYLPGPPRQIDPKLIAVCKQVLTPAQAGTH